MELNLGQKILITIIVLTVPFAVIISYDPFADRLGICNEDICPSDFKISQEKCFIKESDMCVFVTGVGVSSTGVAVQEGTDFWQVYAKDLICENSLIVYSEPKLSLGYSLNDGELRETCTSYGFFDKSEWVLEIREPETISESFATTYTFDRIV